MTKNSQEKISQEKSKEIPFSHEQLFFVQKKFDELFLKNPENKELLFRCMYTLPEYAIRSNMRGDLKKLTWDIKNPIIKN